MSSSNSSSGLSMQEGSFFVSAVFVLVLGLIALAMVLVAMVDLDSSSQLSDWYPRIGWIHLPIFLSVAVMGISLFSMQHSYRQLVKGKSMESTGLVLLGLLLILSSCLSLWAFVEGVLLPDSQNVRLILGVPVVNFILGILSLPLSTK